MEPKMTTRKTTTAAKKAPAKKATPAAKKAAPAKKAPAKKVVKLNTEQDTIPTDPEQLKQLIKITRDRRWRAGRRGDAKLVKEMDAKLAKLTGAPAKKATSSKKAAPAKKATPVKKSETPALKRLAAKKATAKK